MMESASKKRSTNFSSKEEHILISLVKKYKDQIECKKSDTNTNKIKLSAWNRVTNEFNGISGETYRHLQILRNKYENLKKRSKQKFADEKTFAKKTGGGPHIDFYFDEIDQGIKEIVGTQMTGLQSEFDDDHGCGDVLESIIADQNEETEEIDFPDFCKQSNDEFMRLNCSLTATGSNYVQVDASSHDISDGITVPSHLEHDYVSACNTTAEAKADKDWTKYTPDMLKTQKSSPLRYGSQKKTCINKESGDSLKKSRNPLNSKLVEWSSTKIELAEIQKATFVEEHKLKLKHMQEAHDQMLLLKKAESIERMKYMKEEHDMNMLILTEKMKLLSK